MLECKLNLTDVSRSILIVATLIILFGSLGSTEASAYYSLIKEPRATVSSAPVILEKGTAGSSTIYTNNTSAKVSVAAPRTPFFKSSFETGDFTEWTETDTDTKATATIVTSPTHHGSYAAEFTTTVANSWAVARKNFSQIYPTMFARFYVQFTALPAADGDVFRAIFIMQMATANPPSPWYYCLTAAGVKNVGGTSKWYLQFWNGTGFPELTADSPLPEANKWYSVEIKAVRSGTVGEALLWIDGTRILTAKGLDNDSWTTDSRVEVGLGGDPTNAPTTIYIDCVKVADTYIGLEDYDYVLQVVNKVTSAWNLSLKVYDSFNVSRLSNTTISFHDGDASDQIIVSGGNITQSEGSLYNLAGNATIYIRMSNIQATTSGTSYLYVYLKVQVPNTSTYARYIIAFEIT